MPDDVLDYMGVGVIAWVGVRLVWVGVRLHGCGIDSLGWC